MAKGPRKSAKKSPGNVAGVREGRFEKGMDPLFAGFNASISFDKRLYVQDVAGSIAHVKMLGACGIISPSDAAAIEGGLREVAEAIKTGQVEFDENLEDVHINIEHELRKRIGDVAGKLHTARSRNDQVALDLRLYVKEQVLGVKGDLEDLVAALVDKSEQTMEHVLPGYTHLQRAQPVRLAHHLMAYVQMFRRDWERFHDSMDRLDRMPLGSAALAGTTFAIDRKAVADSLGFSTVSANSMDAVADRDFALEFMFNSSMVMMHLSRLSEELIIWSTSEFGFCSLPDRFCSGSSIMPQKKNPDACELIRGKTGRVYGDLMALFTTLKGLPLAYNKDLQEDKEPLFDTVDTVRGCLQIMSRMVPGIEFSRNRMMEAASDPSLAATDLADKIAREGVPFREAHARIGAAIRARLEPTTDDGPNEPLPTAEEMVEARAHVGGTSRKSVLEQIREARSFLGEGGRSRNSGARSGDTKRKG